MGNISTVQAALNALGANPQLVVDGVYGDHTRDAIIAFQTMHGIKADGLVSATLLQALGLPTNSVPPTVVATELPDKPTPMSGEDVTKALSSGYQQVTKQVPSPSVLNLMVAHAAYETGNFGKGIHNFNFGNKKYSSGDPHYQFFRCNEVIDGVNQFFDPPDPRCKFAAYANPSQAGEEYVRLLQGRPVWWNGLHSGDPTTFVTALKTAGYFTGDLNDYIGGVKRYFNEYIALAEKYAIPIAIAGVSSTVLAAIAGAIYLGFKYLKGV
jgi:peptidoglycan hydrolase-like protein with peptidoglycan-binding domain